MALQTGSAAIDDQSVEPGVWRYAHADRATVIVDAEDYFRHMQDTMLNAEQRILLIGWDFDTRIHLAAGRRWWQRATKARHPSWLGSFIPCLSRHRPGLGLAALIAFILRRVLIGIPTLILVSIFVFGLQKLLPGDPILVMAGEDRDPAVIEFLGE